MGGSQPPQVHDPADGATPAPRRWPSVRHTEQNEQCFGQPRTVCTDAHMYRFGGSRSHLAALNESPPTRPAS
jgi:hypothetical protein